VLSISAVVLLGVVVVVLVRRDGLRVWHALVCVLFGFFLATSAVAPVLREVTGQVADLISGTAVTTVLSSERGTAFDRLW